MRLAWLIAIAGCGRIGFASQALGDDATSVDASTLANGLVAYYPLDAVEDLGLGLETYGVRDATGHGHTGSCNSSTVPMAVAAETCPTKVPGRIGNALAFDGVDDYLGVPSTPELRTASGFTVATWVAIDAAPPTNMAACPTTKSLGAGVYNSWAICFYSSVKLYYYTVTGTTTDFLNPTPVIPIGEWHHVAITWDGAMKALALDGVVIATDAAVTDFDDDPVNIGHDIDDAGISAPFQGRIDDLRIYDRVLTSEELAALAAM